MKYSISCIKRKYNKFNTLFFSNTLPNPNNIKIRYTKQGDISAGCTGKNKEGLYKDSFMYFIEMNEELDMNESQFDSVLCHEMIHIWQFERINKEKYTTDFRWSISHDKVFRTMANTINLLAKEYEIDMFIDVIYNEIN